MGFISDVDVTHFEVKKNTETTLACKVRNIGTLLTVSWSGYDEDNENYSYLPGSLDTTISSHTSTLTIREAAVLSDHTFTCTVASQEFLASPSNTFVVQLFVYGKYFVVLECLPRFHISILYMTQKISFIDLLVIKQFF